MTPGCATGGCTRPRPTACLSLEILQLPLEPEPGGRKVPGDRPLVQVELPGDLLVVQTPEKPQHYHRMTPSVVAGQLFQGTIEGRPVEFRLVEGNFDIA